VCFGVPLLLLAAIAWVSGIAIGLSGRPLAALACGVAGVTVAAAVRGRDGTIAALAVLLLGGTQVGATAPPGAAPSLVRAGAVASAEPDGASSALVRWRANTSHRLDCLFGAEAGLVRALLIAEVDGLTPDLRERFGDAGLVHLLSVSGLHIAIVGGALALLFRALRMRAALASGAAVAVATLYVVAIGAPAPAVRSVTLLAATSLATLRQRPVNPWGPFALGALVPLRDPRTVTDLGWQLSVAGYAAILVAGRVQRRLAARDPRWGAGVARELIAGSLATLVTAPLVAWHFGRLSLMAPLSNLAAGPIVAALQPTLFLAMMLPERGGAAIAAAAARPLLHALDGIATGAAAVPGAGWSVAPTLAVAVLAGLAAAALLVAGWSRAPGRALLVGAGACALMPWLPVARPTMGERPALELHLLDVGQGDAVALRTPRGRWILVDAGGRWRGGDAGRRTVVPHLRRRGGATALLILTHPHADHIGGAVAVLEALRPPEIRDAGFVLGQSGYAEVLGAARRVAARWQRVRPGAVLAIDGVELTFLAPDSAWTAALDDPNAASAVVRVRYGAVRFLLTGDAERAEERWMLDRWGAEALAAEVLKVGHHGSRTSTSPPFLAAVRPRVALVSVGAGNRYGHPTPDVMRALAAAGATVLRTDQLGPVVLRTDGRRLEAEAAGRRWPITSPLPASR
jgi:competence protein ComEC